ncbi:MAG: DoxX family protein, partial [Myxococcota bacterium]
GFPMPVVFAWAATLSELLGGLMLAAGLLTRVAALSIVATMAVATFMVNYPALWSKGELGIIFGVVAIFFLIYGGGKKSIDGLLSR